MKKQFSVFRILGTVYTSIGTVFTLLGGSFLFASDDPELKTVGAVFTIVGGVFLVLGGCFLAAEGIKEKQRRELVASGRCIWAEIVDVVPNYGVRVNNRSPVIVLARYEDARGEHLFRSGNIRYYRDERLLGQHVRVYIRDDSFRPYYMDVEPLLPRVINH